MASPDRIGPAEPGADGRALPVVAHVMESYLGLTETFIHDTLTAFRRVRPVVVAARLDHPERFPLGDGALHRLRPARGTPMWLVAALGRRLAPGWEGRGIDRLLERLGARLMHAHFGPAGVGLIPARRRTGIPLVTSFYGYDASIHAVVQEQSEGYRRLFDVGDAFLVEGSAMKLKLEALGCPSSRLRIHRIGIDPTRYRFREREGPGDRPLNLLMCGRMVPKKGHETALRALASARRRDPRLHLTLVGDGPERGRIEGLIEQLRLAGSVTLLGAQPRARFLAELDRAHIYIQPSRTALDGDSEGGAPTTLLEAQASGLPIVTTRHADIPEVVRPDDSALLSEEDDVEGFARNLEDLAAQPVRWASMGRCGRAHVEASHDVRLLATRLEVDYATLAETGRLDAAGAGRAAR